MRGLACGVCVAPKLIANGESHIPSREAAQLGVSGLGTRAGVHRKEADWSAARDSENTPQS